MESKQDKSGSQESDQGSFDLAAFMSDEEVESS